jgi:hypothetical protein
LYGWQHTAAEFELLAQLRYTAHLCINGMFLVMFAG